MVTTMHSNKLIVAIKVNGKILRETGENVVLPFGSEYEILIKNLNSVRAQVDVSVDAQEAIKALIIPANGEISLERFVKDNNKGNRFKFIERTGKIEEVRGIKADDGLVRVEFWYEKRKPVTEEIHHTHHYHYDYDYWHYPKRCYSVLRSCTSGPMFGPAGASTSASLSSIPMNSVESLSEQSDAGITVPGSISEQEFTTVAGFPLEDQSHVIILKLLGKVGKEEVKVARTVKHKQKCSICHTTNKANSKFCKECGSSLPINLILAS